jgi:hypothetical protein
MWWLDLAYAPHLRPEGRRRLLALDAPRDDRESLSGIFLDFW